MIVLLLLSMVAIYIFGSKWWLIRKAGQINRNFMRDIREERKFDSPEALTEQIATDTKRTIEENGEKTWQEFGLN